MSEKKMDSAEKDTKPDTSAEEAVVAPVSEVDYKPNEQAVSKINELVTKREEYLEAIKQIDLMTRQLRYGVQQKSAGPDPQSRCNGFGVAFDMSDYACRELCDRSLHAACKQIVVGRQVVKDRMINKDAERYLGVDVDPNSRFLT